MLHDDVWITGIGLVTSLGNSRERTWSQAVAGASGGRRLDHPLFGIGQLGTSIGAPVTDFDPVAHHIPAKDVPNLDPCALFALAAAHEAILDAGFEIEMLNARKGLQGLRGVVPERVASVVGSGIGGLPTIVEGLVGWTTQRRKTALKRYSIPMSIGNAPAAQIAMRYQCRGECKSISTACAAGTMAIGDAFRLLRSGEADVVICGGTEAMLSDSEVFAILGFDLLKTMSRRNDDPAKASRPFDRDRDGFLLSEGAGIVVLERAAHARARGARGYSRLVSYASTCDASSMMQIDAEGTQIERMVRELLAKAGRSLDEVDYLNAHGTSTTLNDRVESAVFSRLFGDRAGEIPVSANKSMTGHAIAASGAIETALTALSLHRGVLLPTINLENPDPDCPLDYVPNVSRPVQARLAVKTSYGFGGHNAALLLERLEGDAKRTAGSELPSTSGEAL